jgi:DnaJ-domain-containing protein 1
VGVLRKLADATRSIPRRLWNTMGIGDKPLAEMTDEELEAELVRRRRQRGSKIGSSPPPRGESPRLAAAVKRVQVRQWYANLELSPGAPIEQIEARYRELVKKYDPEKHANDPEKHRAATRLMDALGEAYRGLVAQLREEKG